MREGTYSAFLVLFLLLVHLMCCLAKDDCNKAIGIAHEDRFSKEMFSAKNGANPHLARLNTDTSGWCFSNPTSGRKDANIEIDLGEQYKLQQIVTQGTGESTSDDKYVISYKVMYKQHHDAPWKPVRDGKGKEEKIFKGNSDNTTPVRKSFMNSSPYPLYALRIRVKPMEYTNDNACIRLELYGCKVSTLKHLQCHDDSDCDDKAKCNKYTFECKCDANYAGNGVFCADVDECSANKHTCNENKGQECLNYGGGYSCRCRNGFIRKGKECKDVNECATKPAVCGPSNVGECRNHHGGYKCYCRPGYMSLSHSDRGPCVDVDECKAGTNDCADIKNSYCYNLNGSALFVCKCKEGFEMVGRTCEATGFSAELSSIAPYLGGMFGFVIVVLIPIVVIMFKRWKKSKREEKEMMMASLAQPNAMYVGEVESGWFDVDEDLD